MQITLVSSGDTVCDVLDSFVLMFCVNESELNSFFDAQYLKLRSSIRELKEMADFLANAFTTSDIVAPKRNSKVSLAGWISQVLLGVREVVEVSEAIAAPTEIPVAEVEVLEPEARSIYKISLHPDRNFNTKNRGFFDAQVSILPLYLLDRHDDLFEKNSYTVPPYDALYSQIKSEHLSSIATEYGQLIELTTDDLVVYKVNVHGNPPPYVVHKRGVYKRMTWGAIGLGTTVKYAQVVSEHLSNIVVVGAA